MDRTSNIVGILEQHSQPEDWIVVRARQELQGQKDRDEIVAQVPTKLHVMGFGTALELEGFQWRWIEKKTIKATHPRTGKVAYVYAKGSGIQGLHPTIRWDSTV